MVCWYHLGETASQSFFDKDLEKLCISWNGGGTIQGWCLNFLEKVYHGHP